MEGCASNASRGRGRGSQDVPQHKAETAGDKVAMYLGDNWGRGVDWERGLLTGMVMGIEWIGFGRMVGGLSGIKVESCFGIMECD